MDWKTFLTTWRGMAWASRAKDIVIVALLAVSLGLTYTVATQDTVVTLNPPPAAEAVTVGADTATPRYQQLWAVFIAELVGNITPDNAERVRQTIGPFLSAEIRQRVLDSIQDDIDSIQRDDVSATFTTRKVEYDREGKGRVYVTGDTRLIGVADETSGARTYVIDIEVVRYQPRITYFNTATEEELGP